MKRLVDIAGSSLALLLTSPILAIVAILVRRRLGRPVIFRQERPGLHGVPFRMLKFRTMTNAHDAEGHLLPNEQRMTPFGSALRRTSLDELPELVNVLRGEMSLVGPRPLREKYLERYSTRQARRHEVRPGLTGLAQISGRNSLSWDEKLELDVRYVEQRSLLLDLSIIAKTIFIIVARRDGNAGETADEFLGPAASGFGP